MRTRRRSVALALAPLGVALALAGCTAGGGDNEGGGPLPNHRPGETYSGTREDTQIAVDLDDRGCFFVVADGERRLAVWPGGATTDPEDARVVVLDDGSRVYDGQTYQGEAGPLPFAALPGYPNGYWGNQLAFCDPDGTEVLVIDSLTVS